MLETRKMSSTGVQYSPHNRKSEGSNHAARIPMSRTVHAFKEVVQGESSH
jgi:hypothetical protein